MEVKAPDLIRQLKIHIGANKPPEKKRPVMIEGESGIGKSEIVFQVGREIEDELNRVLSDHSKARRSVKAEAERIKFEVIDVRAILMNPVDANGMPRVIDKAGVEHGVTIFTRPGFLPYEGRGIIFFDELTQADPDVQKALFQLILDRKIGFHKLGDGWSIVAAGNTASARGATHNLLAPLANRMAHYTLIGDVTAWCDWAIRNDVAPTVIAFHRWYTTLGRPANDQSPWGLLHKFDARSGERAFPSPRTWKWASDHIHDCQNNDYDQLTEDAGIAAFVGIDAKNQYRAFADLFKAGFSAERILANPETAEIPDNPAICQAVIAYLARTANRENFTKMMTYVRRMKQEYLVAFVLDAEVCCPVVKSIPAYRDFATEFADIMA